MSFAIDNRFKTINFNEKLELIKISLPSTPTGPYLVDDSNFVPMSEAVKQLNRINDPTSGQLSQVYDFPNGKDNGKNIPLSRRHDIKDLAEIYTEISLETKEIADKLSDGYQQAADQIRFEKSISDIKESVNKQ